MGQLIQIERTTESSEVEPEAHWDLPFQKLVLPYDLTIPNSDIGTSNQVLFRRVFGLE